MNYTTEAKNTYLKGIDANKILPDEQKATLKEVISRQFQIMTQYIGVAELICLRERKYYEEYKKNKTTKI